jgi:predicted enzyme related to lactoylglutathione lyase
MSRVVHFEIPADQPERAITFYKSVFGWQFSKWDGPMPYWMITTGPDGEPGINGGLMPRSPESASANVIGVKSLDESIANVQKNGGRIAVPKIAIPGVGWLAYFTDPEGNLFGMMQSDPAAK